MESVNVGELTLGYRAAGNAKNPALVLLHGWPHSSALYAAVLDELARDSYVLAFDLPGVGASQGTPASGEKALLADILLTAAETLGARSILLAGIDVGGMITYSAAREHAARIVGAVVGNTVIPGVEPWSKVIADPRIWHFAFHNVPRLPELLVAGHEREYFEFFFDFLSKQKASLTQTLRDEFTRAYLRPEALATGFAWYRAFEKDAARNAVAKSIDVPFLYLRGDADHRSIGDYLEGFRAREVHNLEGRVIENSGEYLPLEAPQAFCKALQDFRAAI